MSNIVYEVSEIAYKIKNDSRIKDEQYFDSSLIGDLNFDSVDLFYLLLEIMVYFKIKIKSEDVLDYKFNTINGIASCVIKNKMP